MTPISQADLLTDIHLGDVISCEELETLLGFRTSVPGDGIGDRLDMRMIPVVVGKIEDRTECDVSFVFARFFYSIVDASGVDWEEGTRSQCMPHR